MIAFIMRILNSLCFFFTKSEAQSNVVFIHLTQSFKPDNPFCILGIVCIICSFNEQMRLSALTMQDITFEAIISSAMKIIAINKYILFFTLLYYIVSINYSRENWNTPKGLFMVKPLKFYLSLLLARAAFTGIKLFSKSSGTSFAGKMVLKFYPDFLKNCRSYIKRNMITVTGTNGKTTTSGMISHIIETDGYSVIHNLKGANMLTGVANVFALNLAPFKRFDYAVIESDEAYLQKLYDYVNSDYLVVTNLFRDQLDRYGELATTAGFIKNAIDKNPDLKLVLNADDPLVSTFDKTGNAVFYGIESVEYDCSYQHESNAPSENFNCACGNPLQYTKHFMAQEGHYFCTKCGYKRPECSYSADAKVYPEFSELKVKHGENIYNFKVYLSGLYNAYNALAAIAVSLEAGFSHVTIQDALNTYKSIFGRTETRMIKGHKALIQLIKNPTGASEVLKTVDLNSNIVIAINDNYADGRDISWLWDSDFEQLKDAKKLVITSGVRANDMATRLKYAGIPQSQILVEPSVKRAIEIAASSEDKEETITILPSYTALLKIAKMKF